MKKNLLLLFAVIMSSFAFAQVGINTETPTGVLDVVSKTQTTGLVLPRVTSVADVINPQTGTTTVINGTIVYDIAAQCVRAYQNNAWSACFGTVAAAAGSITGINCAGATNTGTLTGGTAASGVSSSIPYTGGNGGAHNGQTVTSTGITGLTATLTAGNFANGAGSLVYNITGTPSGAGTASFAINIGGQTCTLTRTVAAGVPSVLSPTGRTWMDRNLGATQVATSSTDAASYGDLYQWGRKTDGHQIRTSSQTAGPVVAGTEDVKFITNSISPYDWLTVQDDTRWQTVGEANNPCPSGYRLPTETELNNERVAFSTNNAAGAYASALKLPAAGYRLFSNGTLNSVGSSGYYWSSTVSGTFARHLNFNSSYAYMDSNYRAGGFSVRCIKE